ncbi:cellulose synthase/poly-beta-1,6-N-acetylglucosamine synthase-like glycosyltransferase [Flavobacterium nitrogenifigens]|uniref:Cellulose synthase/poly-beta-1,6-N-acetylglucosamine synthase-like glycosyltransferase n=2 Tax=Flavobacterium TaxID=237 RepID=A0A7W7ITW6_9FLAO|nr:MULTISPECIES: glycosyltransferase [Flavobacterium]MBB4800482.1 cellulose synthase/poly-beta-1,6-N-acetylglucosamine synthase-like glycosyltransferase [Flavobacterium nitrogenifigens]MBB6385768.1 cellulose synthase/poly-beta-1,6-N-acetylglucosamine synthase-like glycosyltransferase [Flavobacterium notoginsengisoli]
MIFVFFTILGIYIVSIALLIYGFLKVKKYQKSDLNPKTSFTIIVPFRNEEENLPILLECFSKFNYPKELFEVILVDDNSNEKFQFLNSKFQVSIIDNVRISKSPKKDAITTAMHQVKTDWIITTDADCLVPENWLLTFDNYIQENNISMLAGAVTYEGKNSFLDHFQQLDLTSLQGATIGSFGIHKGFMCNGANFAYKKSLFEELNGFDGNDKIASGDDVFLLQKAIEKFPDEVHYLKAEEAIVKTKPTENWSSLFHQRVRWAAKTSSYKSTFGKALGLIVFFGNLSFVVGFLFLLFGIWSYPIFVIFAFSKFLVDFVLLYFTNRFLTETKIKSLLLSSLLYPFFSSTVAIYSLFGSYQWKGRQFKK